MCTHVYPYAHRNVGMDSIPVTAESPEENTITSPTPPTLYTMRKQHLTASHYFAPVEDIVMFSNKSNVSLDWILQEAKRLKLVKTRGSRQKRLQDRVGFGLSLSVYKVLKKEIRMPRTLFQFSVRPSRLYTSECSPVEENLSTLYIALDDSRVQSIGKTSKSLYEILRICDS